MKECKSARLIEKERKGKLYYFIRLNLVDNELDGKSRYATKDLPTNITVSKRNKAKASAMLEDAITEYSSDTERMYFHHYLDNWLESKKPTVEITTYEGYAYRLKVPKEYFAGKKILLTELKPEHIRDFYNHMLVVEHGTGARRQEGYSNRSIKDTAFLIRSALEEAVTMGYITKSPAEKIKIPQRIRDIKTRAYVGSDEVDIFFDAIEGHRLEIPFTFALYYGLRREEILGLKWSAIRDGKLYIEHTVSKVRTTVAKDRTKTDASFRCYPIPDEIRDKLDVIRARQMRNRELLGKTYTDSDYIFTWEDGRLYSPDYLTKSFKKVVRANERLDDSLTLHSLRASCVSILVHNGTDIKDIQAWVGHKDVQTTLNIYARTNEKQQAAVAQRMAGTLFNTAKKDNPENS